MTLPAEFLHSPSAYYFLSNCLIYWLRLPSWVGAVCSVKFANCIHLYSVAVNMTLGIVVYTLSLALYESAAYAISLRQQFARRYKARRHASSGRYGLYPVYTIKQTSSKHRANIKQMYSKYTCLMFAWSCKLCFMYAWYLLDVCLTLAWNLLDDCFIFAWCLLHRVKGVLRTTQRQGFFLFTCSNN